MVTDTILIQVDYNCNKLNALTRAGHRAERAQGSRAQGQEQGTGLSDKDKRKLIVGNCKCNNMRFSHQDQQQ